MKERPIIFSAEMVRAILEDQKVQTRRVIKPQPPEGAKAWFFVNTGVWEWRRCSPWQKFYCPYGQPGDRLWVRESACYRFDPDGDASDVCAYAADVSASEREDHKYNFPFWAYSAESWERGGHTGFNSPIYMPRWASRITLEITGVRVERVQDISEEDAIAEGCGLNIRHWIWGRTPETKFRDMWDSINAKRTVIHEWEDD